MISRAHFTKRYCKEPLSNVENYEVAINSPDMYELHHRDEIKILPSGIEVRRSTKELKENGRYWQCPANELIFLPIVEHRKMHAFEYRHPRYGKPGLVGEKNGKWKGDDALERTIKLRNQISRTPEAQRLRRLKRKQRDAERVQTIQEAKGVL